MIRECSETSVKLLHIGQSGEERPVVLTEDGRVLDLSPVAADIDGAFLAAGLERAAAAIASGDLPELAAGGERIGPPVARPGKVVCIGLNYREHARETNAQIPTEPVVFLKTPYPVVGPNDTVLIPRGSTKTDYGAELAVVIGHTARYLDSTEEGLACVAGYVVSHDVSEREFQLERGGTWDKGKNCETFNPLGPWLVTADEVPDPQALDVHLWVNSEVKQNSSTKDMIFGVGEIIRYLSRFMVLEPGDLINTGTPYGVALGYPDPQPYLREGDVVELEIAGLGRQRQVIGQA